MALPEKGGNEILTQCLVLIKGKSAFISLEYKNQRNDSSPGAECCGPFLLRQKSCCIAQLYFSRSLRNIKEWLKTSLLLWSLWWFLVLQQAALKQYQYVGDFFIKLPVKKTMRNFHSPQKSHSNEYLTFLTKDLIHCIWWRSLSALSFSLFNISHSKLWPLSKYFLNQKVTNHDFLFSSYTWHLTIDHTFAESKSDESLFPMWSRFIPFVAQSTKNPNISKKVLLLHALKLPCYIHWQLLKYIPQSNIFAIDFCVRIKQS